MQRNDVNPLVVKLILALQRKIISLCPCMIVGKVFDPVLRTFESFLIDEIIGR